MTVEKLSVSMEADLARRARAEAEESGQSLSSFVSQAVEYRLKLEAARKLLSEWEVEHGGITETERAAVRESWPV